MRDNIPRAEDTDSHCTVSGQEGGEVGRVRADGEAAQRVSTSPRGEVKYISRIRLEQERSY